MSIARIRNSPCESTVSTIFLLTSASVRVSEGLVFLPCSKLPLSFAENESKTTIFEKQTFYRSHGFKNHCNKVVDAQFSDIEDETFQLTSHLTNLSKDELHGFEGKTLLVHDISKQRFGSKNSNVGSFHSISEFT